MDCTIETNRLLYSTTGAWRLDVTVRHLDGYQRRNTGGTPGFLHNEGVGVGLLASSCHLAITRRSFYDRHGQRTKRWQQSKRRLHQQDMEERSRILMIVPYPRSFTDKSQDPQSLIQCIRPYAKAPRLPTTPSAGNASAPDRPSQKKEKKRKIYAHVSLNERYQKQGTKRC